MDFTWAYLVLDEHNRRISAPTPSVHANSTRPRLPRVDGAGWIHWTSGLKGIR
jgi:hypothetical protein